MSRIEKIFFVYPPAFVRNREDECCQTIENMPFASLIPPVDMMSLSAIAKSKGYKTKFHDYSLRHETVYDFIRDLREYKPEFLVINVASTNIDGDLSILKEAGDLLQNTLVVVKGSVFNFNSYAILQKYPEVDVIMRGEVEASFSEIISYKDFSKIKGITYQINDKVISTEDREIAFDLNKLPMSDRELINNNQYVKFDTNTPQTVIRVQKGCPNHCFYCLTTPLNGSCARYRDINLVVEEIKVCINKYGINDFIFLSDAFNLNNDYAQKLCRHIIIEGLKINFSCNINIDSFNVETLKLMKQAGCSCVSIGVESSSQDILNKIGKKYTIEQIENVVKIIKDLKIKIHANYILGLPWDDVDSIEDTYKFATELNTEFASFLSATALKGTKFYEYINKNRLGIVNYDMPYMYPSTKSYELSEQQIYEYNKKFNRNYYLRLRYILKMIFTIKSLTSFKMYYNVFLKLIKKD